MFYVDMVTGHRPQGMCATCWLSCRRGDGRSVGLKSPVAKSQCHPEAAGMQRLQGQQVGSEPAANHMSA